MKESAADAEIMLALFLGAIRARIRDEALSIARHDGRRKAKMADIEAALAKIDYQKAWEDFRASLKH